MTTLDIHQAAELAHCSPDHMRKLMKSGDAPGTKIGRAWVVSSAVFQKWLDDRCHFTAAQAARIGGYGLAERLAAQRAQRSAQKRKNSSASSQNAFGAETSSGIEAQSHGMRQPSGG